MRDNRSDTQQILDAIAALADGLRARDARLDALSEQVRIGFASVSGDMEPSASNPLGLSEHEITRSRIEGLAEQVRLLGEQGGTQGTNISLRLLNIQSQLKELLAQKSACKPKKGKKRP